MRLVEVEWVDAHVHDRWVGADELRETAPARCVSVGYLVQDEPEFITLAQSIGTKVAGGVEEYGQPITIPRAALTGEPRELRTKKEATDDVRVERRAAPPDTREAPGVALSVPG